MEKNSSTALVSLCSASDLARFQLLHNSVERYVPQSTPHYVIVDRKHRPAFKNIVGGRTELLTVEDILPAWISRVPGARRWWLSLKSLPIRNWVLQQLVKLSVPSVLNEDIFIFVDSDVTLIRPFDPSTYVRDDRVRLLRVPGANDANQTQWHRTAGKLLGLDPKDYYGASHIGNLVPWRRDNVLKLHAHIESVSGRPWLETVARQWHISEYILYGVFVEHVLGEDAGHYYDAELNCLSHWEQNPLTEDEVLEFLDSLRAQHVAVMVCSKTGFAPDALDRCLSMISDRSPSPRLATLHGE